MLASLWMPQVLLGISACHVQVCFFLVIEAHVVLSDILFNLNQSVNKGQLAK